MEGSSSLVCSADVAAFVDALETMNEAGCYDTSENVVICLPEEQEVGGGEEEEEFSVTDIEEGSNLVVEGGGGTFYNPDTRKLKAIMQHLVAQKKATIVAKSLTNTKGTKQFKSDVWNWFGDVRLFISEDDARRLNIPYYLRPAPSGVGEPPYMICRVFVGCFRCAALFMYDAQKHSTSTLRYHVRACNRPKECIFVSDDKLEDDEPGLLPSNAAAPTKRFRTDPRKQKEVIEQLFQKQRAVVTKKSFMNMKGNRRFKSDVWNWFGDVKLLISRSEAKQLKIPYYIRRCGDEQMVLSKVFVGCFKCLALFIHDSQKSTSTLRYHIRTCSRPKERKKRTTPNIIFFPNKGGRKGAAAATKGEEGGGDASSISAHEKLLNFALSTECSLDVLGNEEFHKILQMCITVGAMYGDVNVDSLLCASSTLSSFVLNDLYVTSINAFYTEFQHAYGATYRPVLWIDEQYKCPFLSVQCSYVDEEGRLRSVTLHTSDFDYDSKTQEDMRRWFGHFLSDQPVIPFKRLASVNNESNFAAAFRDEVIIRCCVQPLSSVLQAVSSKGAANAGSDLPDFTVLLGSCVDLVDHLDGTELASDLVRCVDDKWTSVLALFRSVEAHYDRVLSALNAAGTTHLLSVERSTLTAVVEFFALFEEAIVRLSDMCEPTLNLVIPWVWRLQSLCAVEPRDAAALKQFKSCVAIEMAERLTKQITLHHRMATTLDPRFKKTSVGTPSEQLETSSKLKYLVKECSESPNMEDMMESRRRQHHHHPDEEGAGTGRCNSGTTLDEVDNYMAAPPPPLQHGGWHGDPLTCDFPVLQYWKQHADIFPNLSRVAMWLLSCPASYTAEGESFWSNNWLVHCPRRPISSDNVNKVLFVKTYRGLL